MQRLFCGSDPLKLQEDLFRSRTGLRCAFFSSTGGFRRGVSFTTGRGYCCLYWKWAFRLWQTLLPCLIITPP